jgi:hypothetical protein
MVRPDSQFPTERSQVIFGSAITDEVELELFSAFKKLFQAVYGLD